MERARGWEGAFNGAAGLSYRMRLFIWSTVLAWVQYESWTEANAIGFCAEGPRCPVTDGVSSGHGRGQQCSRDVRIAVHRGQVRTARRRQARAVMSMCVESSEWIKLGGKADRCRVTCTAVCCCGSFTWIICSDVRICPSNTINKRKKVKQREQGKDNETKQ